MPEFEPNTVLSRKEYEVVGKRPFRHDGADKVTGKARYGADITLPGLLHGKVLRSPHAHAWIRDIDTRAALEVEGVRAVITSADFGDIDAFDQTWAWQCRNILARERVFYKGHGVAAVATTSAQAAEEALECIQVTYEELPAVFDGEQAMSGTVPELHEGLQELMDPEAEEPWPANVGNRYEFELGDPDAGFSEADVIVENDIVTKAVHQGYIEPHSGTAMWHEDGRLTIWSSSQGHFSVRDFTAKVVGLPPSQVRAVPLEIGGGFGAKLRTYMEPLAALLARHAGAPVKVTMSRVEVFEATGPASGTHITVKLGAKSDGRLTAATARLMFEAGWFPGSSVMGGARNMFSPYDIPNGYIEAWDVVVNRPKSGAYRAPGTPQAAFCMETALDELAEKLEIDPLELRLKNCAREGTRRIAGPALPKVGFVDVLEAARDHEHYQTAPEPLRDGYFRGRGVASGFWGNGSGPSSALALVQADGTVSLSEGSPDIGGSRTAVAQQFAEVLHLPIENVHPKVVDTDSIGVTSNTGGSGVAFKTGIAACSAAEDVIEQMRQRAALIWELDKADGVEFVDGVFCDREGDRQLSFREIAARQPATGGAIVGRAGVNPGGAGPALATHIVDVEVDTDTGKVTILRYTSVQDAGKAIHPSYVEGQIQGGAAQGVGWALNEEYYTDDSGRMLNSSFLDYRMPTSLDLPMLDTVIVEVANPNHPFGVRGVGEVPIVPPMAAVANAIHDAVGVRLNELPMSPPVVQAAIAAADDEDARQSGLAAG
ncbi:MAG: xanthine dehydrogenase family protein molybdopterin-binding subunit [Candidatus Latescibacterota bacterium]|nr:xanthine dehydrogenase family protein molybdopterin-binding subunit [Candidatus Latescibacterota bacterium]